MKPKARKRSAPRNPFVAAALFKKAGTHAKSNKALRRHEKVLQGRLAHLAEQAFNRMVPSSNLGAPTTRQSEFQSQGFRNAFCILKSIVSL